MTSSCTYEGNLRNRCVHIQSGTVIITDAPVDNEGKGEAFSPTDLCATSLAACMLTVMGIKAKQSGMNLEGSYAEVQKDMISEPRRIGGIHIRIEMKGQAFSEKQRDILERIALNCPVYHSLHPEIEKSVLFDYGG